MALTKASLSQSLVKSLKMNKKDAKDIVDYLFEEIRMALEEGSPVKISGFGNFDLRDKNERPGRNPKTGKDVSISARRVVTFKSGQKLKIRVEHFEGTPEGKSQKEDSV
jgi:integration host factor subunit alpha